MSAEVPRPPALSNLVPSGVPERLADIALAAKQKIWSYKTYNDRPNRRKGDDLPVLPPEITREHFNIAIQELRQTIGNDYVILNDKPLVDGWYMENPYVLS